ncbi:unnamed protein product [Sympodiomycopsis kandeliae]
MDGFGFSAPQSWQQQFHPQQTQQPPAQFENHEVNGARSQVIDSITRLSTHLRNAADVCDNFVRIVARNNPVAVANALGQPSGGNNAGRANDFNNFLSGNATFLSANGAPATGLPPQPGAASQGQPSSHHPTGGPSGNAVNPQQQGSASGTPQQLPPGLSPDDYDANGKKLSKRQKKLLRKARDPDAPKRPPSAYLLFQNEVRADMREKFPEMPYKEILGKVSEAWKNLSEEDRKIYQDKTNDEMKRWSDEKNAHEGPSGRFGSDSDDYANSTAMLVAAGAGSTSAGSSTAGNGRPSSTNSNAALAPGLVNDSAPATPDPASKKRKEGGTSKKEKRPKN